MLQGHRKNNCFIHHYFTATISPASKYRLIQVCWWSHSLIFWIQSSLPSSLPLDGLHGGAIQTFLGLWSALIWGHCSFRPRIVDQTASTTLLFSAGLVHVVDAHQQTVIHDLETLQELQQRNKCNENRLATTGTTNCKSMQRHTVSQQAPKTLATLQ